MRTGPPAATLSAVVLLGLATGQARLSAQEAPPNLGDRGVGVPTSIFATYIRKGELIVYPFYEYVRASAEEYHGSELGFFGDTDYLGSSKAHEAVLFVAYGLTDDLAIELESELYVTKELKRAPDDTTTGMPAKLEESGPGETEAQLRWRISRESVTRPELFSNLEVTFPLQTGNVLIGASDWGFAAGFGAVKGFRFGTLTSRISIGYSGEDGSVELGEYAVEYLKRLSNTWRGFAVIEGEDDELSLILGARWQASAHVSLAFNSGFGITEKADDFAPEIGVMFSFR